MYNAEYYYNLKKSEEYAQKARTEPDLLTKRALEAVAREFLRRAEETESQAT
jgi:hypothetical protein